MNASACKAWPNAIASRPNFPTCVYLRLRLARAIKISLVKACIVWKTVEVPHLSGLTWLSCMTPQHSYWCLIAKLYLLVGGAVASWLVRSSPDRVVRVWALARDIVLCSWARHFTHTVPLSTQVYKWVPANLMLGVILRWTSIPSRGE